MFTCIASIGKMSISLKTGIKNQQINTLIPKASSFYFKFIYYIIYLNRNAFINLAPQTTIPIINKTDFSAFSFTIPTFLPEQRKIARILSTVDEVIERTEAAIAKYQAIKQGMMHDLFSRGLDQNGKLRPRYEEAPELYHQTTLGWLPKEWEVVDTDEKINVIDVQPDHRTPPEVSDGAPYVGIGDLKATGEIDLERARKVAKAALQKQVASFDIYPGAFIFGKIGTLGQPTRIPSERFFAVSANVVLLTTKLREDADFIFWLYSSHLIDTQVTDTTNTTSQPALGIQRVRKFFIPWPACSGERDKIASKLEAISKTLQNEARHRDKTLQVKQGLMQALLTGRKPVTVDEPEQEN